jgi:type VI secretion system protein ImpK
MNADLHAIRGPFADAYTDILLLGAAFRDAKNLGSVELLRKRLVQMFTSAEERAKSMGGRSEECEDARYAMAAFVDEMIATSRWDQKEHWAGRPLQYEFFGEYVAGEGFFKRLDAIRSKVPIKDDLMELYVLCMTFGFEGQYRLNNRERLRGLIDDVAREIQAKRGMSPVLSPHGQRPEELLEMVKKEFPAWVVLATSIGVVFLVYLALVLLIAQDGTHVAEEISKILREKGI